MQNFNSYWIASVPRTGSMWTTNVIKEILINSNLNVLPNLQLKTDNEYLELYKNQAFIDKNNLNKYVFKIHTRLASLPPKSKVITNIRNPYDICASFYEFMSSNLEKAIECGFRLSIFINHYKNISKDVFMVKYEEIENQPKNLIKKLADLCDVSLSEKQIEKIIFTLSKDNISKLIEKNDNQIKSDKINKKNIDSRKIIIDEDENYRYFDLKTGFQTNHISSRKTGQWKVVFSKQQIEQVIKKLDPIAIEFGYNSEK